VHMESCSQALDHLEAAAMATRASVISRACLSAPDFVAAYILAYVRLRHGLKWCCGKRVALPTDGVESVFALDNRLVEAFEWQPRELHRVEGKTLCDLFSQLRLTKLPQHVGECLNAWYRGERPLKLMHKIPSPEALLRMQASGERACTAFLGRDLERVYGHRDPLEFLLHDLSHMEKFVANGLYYQQVGFFAFLCSSCAPRHAGTWSDFGHGWRLAWNYVTSDMNASVCHLAATFVAQLMVAVSKRLLGVVEDDAEWKDTKADVYPRGKMGPLKVMLAERMMLNQFEGAFSKEIDIILADHCSRAIFAAEAVRDAADLAGRCLGASFDDWASPTQSQFLQSFGRLCTDEFQQVDGMFLTAHFHKHGQQLLKGGRPQ